MTLPILLVLAAAIVFAALAGRLAAGRGRSRPAWTLFGAVLGPIALVVLLVAPPGRCPTCGMRTRGWPTACASCGRLFGGTPSTVTEAPPAAHPASAAPTAPIVAATVLPEVAVRTMAARPLVADPPSGSSPTPIPTSRPSTTTASRPSALPPLASPATPRRRRPRSSPDRLGPDAMVVATGVFIAGTAPTRTRVSILKIGERYGIARTADEIQILGPVYVDHERIVARIPAAGATASLDGDRLVMVWPSDGGATLAFSGVAIATGVDPAASLTVAPAGTDPAATA